MFLRSIIGVITPYMVDPDAGNLGSKVFFVWGSLCILIAIFAYTMVPETKGLSLEQVDKMLEETVPATSSKWKPHETFTHEMGMEKGQTHVDGIENVAEVSKSEAV